MPTSSAVLKIQLTFDSYFLGRVLARLRFLPIPKMAKEVVSNFLGGTFDKEYYLPVMRNLRETVCQKRPDL